MYGGLVPTINFAQLGHRDRSVLRTPSSVFDNHCRTAVTWNLTRFLNRGSILPVESPHRRGSDRRRSTADGISTRRTPVDTYPSSAPEHFCSAALTLQEASSTPFSRNFSPVGTELVLYAEMLGQSIGLATLKALSRYTLKSSQTPITLIPQSSQPGRLPRR